MLNKFTVPEVRGSKRESRRLYTHAVIGVYNWAQRLARDDKDSEHDGADFDYYVMCVNTGLGNKYKANATGTMYITVDEGMYNKYAPIVEQYKTREAYIAACRAQRVAFDKSKMEQPEVLEVLRWSQSCANASKGHGEFSSYKNIKVVSVVRLS